MKKEKLIKECLNQKLGILISGFNSSMELKEHIRMLDWVLTDGRVRSIDTIIKHRVTNPQNIQKLTE